MPEQLNLYHHTSEQAAAAILANGSMVSRENTQEAFFSTERDSAHVAGYGPAVVHIRVPADWIEKQLIQLDDEFELDDGRWEDHYSVPVKLLRPEHFIP